MDFPSLPEISMVLHEASGACDASRLLRFLCIGNCLPRLHYLPGDSV